jgi:DNA-binding CsgD family transcriptional regulator
MDVVLELIKDQRNKDAAYKLGLAEKTIATHQANIFAKVGCQTRVGLLLWAFRRNLIPMDEAKTA